MSLISRLRAVVAGDDYLDGDLDDLVYDDDQPEQDQRASQADGGQSPTISLAGPLIRFWLIVLIDQIIKIAIEIVVTSDDGTQAGNQRHLETPLGLRRKG